VAELNPVHAASTHGDQQDVISVGCLSVNLCMGDQLYSGWNFADIFFSDSVKIMRFNGFAGTSIS